MNARQFLSLSAAALLFASGASAQFVLFPTTVTTQRVAYDGSLGNSWLGGRVHAHATLETRRGWQFEQGLIDLNLNGHVNLLTRSTEVVEVAANLRNKQEWGVQTRTGSFRVEVLGFSYVNQSFTNDSQFAQRTWSFNVFPVAPSASVPLGPFSITLRGNAGASLSTGANFNLPAATPSVTLAGSARGYASANASVGIGIPGFEVGVGIDGRICDQTLAIWATANARTGISGAATYTLEAIALRLYAYARALFYTYSTTLTNWSAGRIVRTLL